WREKIGKNRQRDKEVNALLKSQGWKVLRFWEHELKSNAEACARQVIKTLKVRRAPGGGWAGRSTPASLQASPLLPGTLLSLASQADPRAGAAGGLH
ncbi:MAG TPA: DUF559 domain-containing protein, partial [Gammaproteobacteria bacterium]|nr:DUF559 domain-containing protein [Gammaproteobacteria bacterium]